MFAINGRNCAIPEMIGRYTLIRILGQGASARVYLAHDGFSGRHVAIKVFWRDAGNDDPLGARHRTLFLNEASLVGRLQHPHIVSLLDAAVEHEFKYIAMEYVPGGTLKRHITPDTLLPLEKVLEIAFKLSRALDYAYRHGVIHRDIKPANVLLTEEWDVKVSDFGGALLADGAHTALEFVGSPAYSSPEQLDGAGLGPQSDLWSLGVVMYQMLCGRLPFEATSHASLIYQIGNSEPAPLAVLRADLPDSLVTTVERALKKDQRLRYQGWDELSVDLAGLMHRIEPPRIEALSEARRFEALRGLAFFRDFQEVEIWETLRAAQWRHVSDGRTILRERERGDSLYLLVDGCVEVSRCGQVLATLIAGACFGELLYFDEEHTLRTTTVRAIGEIALLEIRAVALAAASSACQVQFNRAFLRILLARLDDANRKLAQSKEPNSLPG